MPNQGNHKSSMQYQPHHRVNIKNVQHGDIYWLPPKQLCDSEAQAAMIVDIDDGCYNHPLLIYAVHRKRKEVLALFITSFGSQRLEDKFPKQSEYQRRVRSQHLAISPVKHPDMALQLNLQSDFYLPSKSYVKIETPTIIPAKLLKKWKDGARRLEPESYRALQALTCFKTPSGFLLLPEGPIGPSLPTVRALSDRRPLASIDGNRGSDQQSYPRLVPTNQSPPDTVTARWQPIVYPDAEQYSVDLEQSVGGHGRSYGTVPTTRMPPYGPSDENHGRGSIGRWLRTLLKLTAWIAIWGLVFFVCYKSYLGLKILWQKAVENWRSLWGAVRLGLGKLRSGFA